MRRITSALISKDIEPTPHRSVHKDHKEVPPPFESLSPPSRPIGIGDGNNAPDSQLSWILATICQKAADSLSRDTECTSTEDMLASVDKINIMEIRASNQVCVSLDY